MILDELAYTCEFFNPMPTPVTFNSKNDAHNKVLELCRMYPYVQKRLRNNLPDQYVGKVSAVINNFGSSVIDVEFNPIIESVQITKNN